MKRREFIKFTSFTFITFNTSFAVAKVFEKESLLILDEIFKILFPKTKSMPSAKEFSALNFLVKNIAHESFYNDEKTFILQGLEDFKTSFPNFMNLSDLDKKILIETIVNTNSYAQSWLSKLVYYGLEAMFSDPMYGGNKNQVAWKSVAHSVGYPRPKLKYGQKL